MKKSSELIEIINFHQNEFSLFILFSFFQGCFDQLPDCPAVICGNPKAGAKLPLRH